MKPLRRAIDDYITLRRSLGFKLRDMAHDLQNFAAFMEQKAASYVTTELAMEWAMQPTNHQPSSWAQRLGFVRVFARHWHATDPRTEIPPAGLLPFRPQRARPYLYSELEIKKLLAAALKLSPSQGLRPRTYHCLFGLLTVAGLRISEALKLEQPDVDLGEGILTIRQTKFGKTRLVPLHTSTRDVMADYARRRDRFLRNASSPCFFLNDHGRRLDSSAVRRTFYGRRMFAAWGASPWSSRIRFTLLGLCSAARHRPWPPHNGAPAGNLPVRETDTRRGSRPDPDTSQAVPERDGL
jgi:integrase/recombinase XerD